MGEHTGDYMKYLFKKSFSLFLLIILIIFTLCSCNRTEEIKLLDSYVFNQDSQENCISVGSVEKVAESSESYYYLSEFNKFVYIIDKTSKKCMPLCNKPDCLHDKESMPENCNAYLGTMANNIVLYNDYLYYSSSREITDKDGVVHTVYEINKITLDGSSKSNVFSTEEYTIWSFKIHRGYIYADMSLIDSEGCSEWSNSALYKISIEDTSKISEFLSYYKYSDTYGFLVSDTRFYGNNLILLFNKLNSDNKEERILVNYNLKTDEWINLSEKLNVNVTTYFTVCNGDIYYGANNCVYRCNLNGDNQICVIDGADDKYNNFSNCIYFNPLTNDGENVLVSLANDNENSDSVIFYNCKTDEIEIHTIKTQNQADIGGDGKSLINKLDNSLYFYDKIEKKAYTIYDFV